MSLRKTFKFKVKLSPSAVRRAEGQLTLLCELYNAALQERRDAWQRDRVSLTFFSQSKQLPGIKESRTEFKEIDAQATEQCLRRLDLAFSSFFRRVKAGENPGYPRFKSRKRYSSITFRNTGWRLEGKRLTLRSIGTAKLFLSRPIEGDIKTVTLQRDRCGDWWVSFSCENVAAHPLEPSGSAVGVDVGLESFLTTSEGERIENPRHLRKAESNLKRAHRRVSKRSKGSARRAAMIRTLARRSRSVANARRDFHFKTANWLVQNHDTIAVEDLNIRGLARGILAKSVNDAGWAQFLDILAFKAVEAGRQVIAVDPRGTSQVCSGCGCLPEVPKPLKLRTHNCPHCGLSMHRDHNAAVNILTRARAEPSASGPASRGGRVDLRTPDVTAVPITC